MYFSWGKSGTRFTIKHNTNFSIKELRTLVETGMEEGTRKKDKGQVGRSGCNWERGTGISGNFFKCSCKKKV